MAVLRIHKKQQNFVILDKTCLNDARLSWGAKGLHAYLISLPDTWQVRVEDLKKRATNGRDAVRSLLKELEQAGYIQKFAVRNQENGRFGRLEYLVLETPATLEGDIPPGPEKASLVQPAPNSPAPEKPALEMPGRENPSLVNNKENKYLLEQEIKAAAEIGGHTSSIEEPARAAAVFCSQKEGLQNHQTKPQPELKLTYLNQDDALISTALTSKQQQRVQQLVAALNVEDTTAISEEITYCLLNPRHFTACGRDFSKKLNAIRQVILRGDWQTPTAMVTESLLPHHETLRETARLEQELRAMQAEASHFEKMLDDANEHARVHFEQFIARAHSKIQVLQDELLALRIAEAS